MNNWLFHITWMIVLLSPNLARAHALRGECILQSDNRIRIEAFFSDNSAALAVVEVYKDKVDGKPIARGKTNALGICFLPCPGPGKYLVVIDAGSGHRKEIDMNVPDVKLAGVVFAVAAPSLGTIDSVGIFAGLARDWCERNVQVDGPTIGPGNDLGIISDTPTRKQATQFPWQNVGIGLACIALMAVIALAVRRRYNAI